MPDYHRTQIQLETWQYEQLKRRAAEEGISLSELIRRIVGQELAGTQRFDRGHLMELAGAFSDPGFDSRDHDEVIYGPGGDA